MGDEEAHRPHSSSSVIYPLRTDNAGNYPTPFTKLRHIIFQNPPKTPTNRNRPRTHTNTNAPTALATRDALSPRQAGKIIYLKCQNPSILNMIFQQASGDSSGGGEQTARVRRKKGCVELCWCARMCNGAVECVVARVPCACVCMCLNVRARYFWSY